MNKPAHQCPLCWGDVAAVVVECEEFTYVKLNCKKCEIKWTENIPTTKYVKPK